MTKKKFNSNTLFYVVVAYILLQFIWWEVLLVKQTREIHREKETIVALGATSDAQLKQELAALTHKENMRIYMILGEGTIFLIVITIAIIRVYRAHRREKEISLQQKNFLLSVSHELKTPLATSKLSLQTLLSRQLSPEIQQEIISSTLYENERLTQLIENILISTRLDDVNQAGTLLINKENINISELSKEVLQKAFTSAQQKRIHASIGEHIFLVTDKAVFPSIIINLVENALKYSPADAGIEFKLSKQDNSILLQVSDTGPGISASDKQKIFEKFYRVGNEETRNNKGTGLGLFIVKKMVEMHNGKIVVKDNSPKGTLFEVMI
jgi:signal transduction histidine kinase